MEVPWSGLAVVLLCSYCNLRSHRWHLRSKHCLPGRIHEFILRCRGKNHLMIYLKICLHTSICQLTDEFPHHMAAESLHELCFLFSVSCSNLPAIKRPSLTIHFRSGIKLWISEQHLQINCMAKYTLQNRLN